MIIERLMKGETVRDSFLSKEKGGQNEATVDSKVVIKKLSKVAVGKVRYDKKEGIFFLHVNRKDKAEFQKVQVDLSMKLVDRDESRSPYAYWLRLS